MKKVWILLLAVLLVGVCLCGCNETPNTDDDLPPDTSVAIAPLLTADEIYEASAIRVGDPQEFEAGAVGYFSEDNTAAVYVAAQETTKEQFDAMLEGFSAAGTLTDAPNLGEKAVWCEEQLNLLVYAEGVTLDIRVEYATARPNDSLLAARHLAALLIGKM